MINKNVTFSKKYFTIKPKKEVK
ncbi:hypothetical protein CMTB2_07902 [Caminibacter mediatlanticus TB-2]|uniref:Uncharacterized protein n=1 Tax=Caminibacter mediatlanticus TB-2 TaxID=391592 RepID=A0AAI9AGY6_9BACT|nr:hypothetical protein CMTB2_07902 [Caminibacter mediatlanticus TB-2]